MRQLWCALWWKEVVKAEQNVVLMVLWCAFVVGSSARSVWEQTRSTAFEEVDDVSKQFVGFNWTFAVAFGDGRHSAAGKR